MTTAEPVSAVVPATSQVIAEAEALSEDILKDIELTERPLSSVVLKAMRLARILNDFDAQQTFEWESGGYPSGKTGLSEEVTEIARRAGRREFRKESNASEPRTPILYTGSIEQMERAVSVRMTSLPSAETLRERSALQRSISRTSRRLASRRTFVYKYALRKHYELKLAGVTDNVFGRIRASVDASIGVFVPDAVKKLSAIYDNLGSGNPEDWANAAHSCRRALQDLADAVFPPRSETRLRKVDGKTIEVKLGPDHYINRLIAYVEASSESERFNEIVGSHLDYMGNRLDALFGAAQKGSHATITKEEADRCVIYTYLLIGDILSLRAPETLTPMDTDHEDYSGLVEEPESQIPDIP